MRHGHSHACRFASNFNDYLSENCPALLDILKSNKKTHMEKSDKYFENVYKKLSKNIKLSKKEIKMLCGWRAKQTKNYLRLKDINLVK